MSHLAESNCGPRLYERRALPTELRWREVAVSENLSLQEQYTFSAYSEQ